MSRGKIAAQRISPAIWLVTCGLLVMDCVNNDLRASEKEEKAEIVERAKQEREVALYTAANFEDLSEVNAAFEKKYPSVKVKLYRTGSAKLITRAQTEYRAGHYTADVFGLSFWGMQQFHESGLLGTYKSPEAESIPDYCKDRDGYWTCDYINVGIIAYNTKLVPLERAPKSYQDLLNPWWRGKIGLDDTGHRWYGSMLSIMGREKGQVYMQSLAQQKLGIRRGQSLLAQLLAAGEFAAAINLYNAHIELLKSRGASVEWVAPLDQPTIMTSHVITIAKNPPHRNAAKLYIDFVLSREGQQILVKRNRVPSRVDVAPDPPRLVFGADGKRLRFQPVDLDFAKKINLEEKEFGKLFLQRRGN